MRSKLTGTRESDAQSTLSSLTAGLLLSIRENPNPRQGTFRGNHHAFEARSRDVLSFGHHPMAECPRCCSRALSHPAIFFSVANYRRGRPAFAAACLAAKSSCTDGLLLIF